MMRIHFAARPPSKLWSMGVVAFSHAEWVGSCALAERKASRWRKEPCVEAIEILEARQVRCFRKIKGRELAIWTYPDLVDG
jgi:hypothetical protein